MLPSSNHLDKNQMKAKLPVLSPGSCAAKANTDREAQTQRGNTKTHRDTHRERHTHMF